MKQKRGKWLAPGNISWAMLGMAVKVFSTTRAITLERDGDRGRKERKGRGEREGEDMI